MGCYQTNISGAEGIGIGTGSQNTIDILLGCPNPTTAANLCANLTLGGYSDWFLPSKDELNEMYLNIGQGNTLGLGNIGQFWGYLYWTSSEAGSNTAYAMNFGDGYMGHILKNYDGHVRAIRAFGGLPIYGCTDQTAINYNSIANNDDGSCLIPGCTDPTACNYDPTATIDDGSCEFISCSGCTDPIALNFNPTATIDDGSCVTIGSYYQGGIIFYLDGNGGGLIAAPFDQANSRWGCAGTLLSGVQSPAIGAGAGNTINIVSGCTTPNIAADICSDLTLGGYSDWFLPSLNELNQMYINRATINMTAIANGGGSFDELNTPWYYSSTQWNGVFARYQNFNTGIQDETNKYNIMKVRAVRAFSGASNPLPYGCMDVAGCNYDPNANTDDGSCTYPATNANCAGNCLAGFIDINGICVAFVYGCMDATACNYDPNANTDDGSCEFTTCAGCTDPTACTYDPSATIDDGSCVGLVGCTYIGSPSYDPLATCGDTTTQCLLIGDMFYGGMIFYLDGTGKGCVASMECINAACQVVCSSYSPDEFWSECGTPPQGTQIDAKFPWSTISCAPTMWLGADGAGMFDGRSNTIAILEYCDGCDGVYNANQTAARMAANAANNSSSGTKSSSCETDEWGNPNPDYARWFLPTKQQLNAMYNNIGPGNVLGLGNIGLFEETGYWSSTEESLDKAWRKSFDPSNGQNATRDKSTQYRVRAVRCFNCNIPGECD